jgi:hypothetical protein
MNFKKLLSIAIAIATLGACVGPSDEKGVVVTPTPAASKSLIATFYQGNNSSTGCQTQGGASADHKYFATPFRTNSIDFTTNATVTSKYIGLGLLQSGPTSGPLVPLRIEIQSDSNGSPSGNVLSNAIIGSYGLEGANSGSASASVPDRYGSQYVVGRMPVQGYFGSGGLTLNANTTYWAVAVYLSGTRPDIDRCGASEPTAFGQTKISSDGTNWVNSTTGYLPRVALFDGEGNNTNSTSTFTISGSVSGLSGGQQLTLLNNNTNPTIITSNSSFTFSTPLANNSNYAVTVGTQPVGQTCTVRNGSGSSVATNVTNVTVTCGSPWIGTKQLGATGALTTGNSVATDSSGNVYVTGSTNGNLDGNTLTGTNDVFLTKYDSSGNKLFTKQLGAVGAETYGNGIAIDSIGNVYITGGTSGNLDGNTRSGTTDVFLTKYDSSGNKLFTKQLGVSSAQTQGQGIAIDSNSNVYITGNTSGNLDGNTLNGTTNFFLSKYDSSGNKLFTKQLGATSAYTYGVSVATDSSANVFVTGRTNGNLDGNTLTGSADFFLTKYDSSGNKLFTKQLGAVGATTYGYGVATSNSGNVYVTGYTNGNLDGNTLTGSADFFLTKYDNSGNKLFTKQLGAVGAGTTGDGGISTDSSGNIYVAGSTNGNLDGNTLSGTNDSFLTKYDASGNRLFTKQLGVTNVGTRGLSLAKDNLGNLFVAGFTAGRLDGNLLRGTWDFFVTKYDNNGVKQ